MSDISSPKPHSKEVLMFDRYNLAQLSAAVLTLTLGYLAAAEVRLDPTTTYQTIEGIGRCRIAMHRVQDGPFSTEAPFEPLADSLINVVGLSFIRDLRTSSDDFNPAPGQYVFHDELREAMEHNRYLKELADSAGQVFRFCPNVFSPPGYMKANGLARPETRDDPDNYLLPEYYDEFATMCSTFVCMARDTFGLPVYAFSPQNEPWFTLLYETCEYTAVSYADMLSVVGPAIKAASPTTLIYGTEEVIGRSLDWEQYILSRPGLGQYLDRIAVHGNQPGAVDHAEHLPSVDRPLWITEDGAGPPPTRKAGYDSPDSALGLASKLQTLFVTYNFSAASAPTAQKWYDEMTGRKYGAYWVHAHFARFMRPNMKRIKAELDTALPGLLVGAYANSDVGSFSIIVLNTGAEERTLAFGSTTQLPASFEARRSGPSEYFVDIGTVSLDAPITVPGRSILSLGHRIRGNDGATRNVQRPADREYTQRETHRRWNETPRLFDLRGRSVSVSPHTMERPAPGAYFRVRRDGSGGLVVHGLEAHSGVR
jgi:O-glycosyl hydrolase